MKYHLVTGGIGFIGYHVCKELLDRGKSVVCIDNLSSAHIENVAALKQYPHFRFINADVVTTTHSDVPLEAIWHLACPASPPFYQADPVHTMMTCVVGTKNMLELALLNDCPLLFTSTSEVYGNPEVHPQVESYLGNVNPTGIRSCYDEGKRAAEALCFDYGRTYGVDARVVRLFNTYGTNMRQDDGRAVSNFIMQALHNKPITVYGDGTQTRSLCYVSDTVRALFAVMEHEDNHGVMNIGNPNELTIHSIASDIITLINSKSEIEFHPLPSDDPCIRRPDISKISSKLGWKPAVSLIDGLEETIRYFRQL